MKSFNHFLIEQKNTHMEHIEDLVFNEGVNGTRKAIQFLIELRNMLAGHTKTAIKTTVKWDGAPAVFCGIDPSDGQFFVAKKGIFNKEAKVYKTPDDVKADTGGDLQSKLLIALSEFSKLGIKSGVYQGDLMFTKDDISTEDYDGEKYYTFQPNTIVYAVPVKSPLGKQIAKAKIGVVWHTTYTGKSFDSMKASFGKGIVSKFNKVSSVWQDDATYQDLSGNATFTKSETDEVTSYLSNAGRLFKRTPAKLIDEFSNNPELLARTKVFMNSLVRNGQVMSPRNAPKQLMDALYDYYQKEIEKKKTPRAKETWEQKRKDVMKVFTDYRMSDFQNLFELINNLVNAKNMIVNKMNEAGSLKTFVRTRQGFKVTGQEGFVAIDHIGNAVKIVDRLEFSRANFSSDVIKGWER
jgi:hypothetical protein